MHYAIEYTVTLDYFGHAHRSELVGFFLVEIDQGRDDKRQHVFKHILVYIDVAANGSGGFFAGIGYGFLYVLATIVAAVSIFPCGSITATTLLRCFTCVFWLSSR